MGYSVKFKIPKEKIDNYKPNFIYGGNDYYKKMRIKMYCLIKHDYKDLDTCIQDIDLDVKCLITFLQNKYKLELLKRFNAEGEITFSGWEFSAESAFEESYLKEMYSEKLCILAIVCNDIDYYHEKFGSKLEEIEETLNDLDNSVESLVIHNFIEEFKEYKVNESY